MVTERALGGSAFGGTVAERRGFRENPAPFRTRPRYPRSQSRTATQRDIAPRAPLPPGRGLKVSAEASAPRLNAPTSPSSASMPTAPAKLVTCAARPTSGALTSPRASKWYTPAPSSGLSSNAELSTIAQEMRASASSCRIDAAPSSVSREAPSAGPTNTAATAKRSKASFLKARLGPNPAPIPSARPSAATRASKWKRGLGVLAQRRTSSGAGPRSTPTTSGGGL